MTKEKPDISLGLSTARKIAASKDDEWAVLFEDLRSTQKLSRAIREMNELEFNSSHGRIVRKAFARMGLDQSA